MLDLEAVGREWQELPISGLLGLTMDRLAAGECDATMEPPQDGRTTYGAVQGALLSGFAEMVAGITVRSTLRAGQSTNVIGLDLQFTDQVHGTPVTAKGRLRRRGRSVAFTEVTLYDATGCPCVRATGISHIA